MMENPGLFTKRKFLMYFMDCSLPLQLIRILENTHSIVMSQVSILQYAWPLFNSPITIGD